LDFIALAKAALLGIIQGLTEFLPISSTAHLLLGADLLGYDDHGGVFTVMIQLGSILAVMWLYRAKIIEVIVGLPTKPEARRFAFMLIVAFLPAMIAGYFLEDFVRGVLYQALLVMAWAFVLGGLVMLAIERWPPKVAVHEADKTPIWRALGVGIVQCVALIPGVSRSGATIVGGLLLGLDRRAAAEFSFFLAMPTMAAAFVYDVINMRNEPLPTEGLLEIAVGFVFAFIAAALVVKPFLNFVTRVGFAPFAWYRIALGALLFAGLGLGWFGA
jgi:undecaprenyl-diphosphatase